MGLFWPNSLIINTYFEWGTTTSYGNQTTSVDIGSGTDDVAHMETVGTLNPETQYHYRLVVESAGGTAFGADQTFTTLSVPVLLPPVLELPANGTTECGIVVTLRWEDTNHVVEENGYLVRIMEDGGAYSDYLMAADEEEYEITGLSYDLSLIHI